MHTKDYILLQLSSLREQARDTLQDTTESQLNWTPPGTVNSIKATFLHLVTCEDVYIQGVLRNKPLVWETGGWDKRIGLENIPGVGDGWEQVKAANLALAPLLEYDQAVQSATRAYLEKLDDEELTRVVRFYDNDVPAAAVLVFLVTHSSGHLGEIAAVKGMQGAKGLPF
jgi:uncharacterized damage-inducible protein DinB